MLPFVNRMRISAVGLAQLSRSFIVLLAGFFLTTLVAPRMVLAQQSPIEAAEQGIGIPNNTTEFKVPLGLVNLTNGNLHQEIVFSSTRQRGHMPPVVLKAVYDSRYWEFPTGGSSWWPAGGNGWNIVTTGITGGFVTYDQQPLPCNDAQADTIDSNYRYIDEEGHTHMFWEASGRNSVNITLGVLCATNTGDSGYATDGSGYFIKINVVKNGNLTYVYPFVYGPDGNQVYPNVEDSNGNYFNYLSGGNAVPGAPPAGIDTLGRVPYTITVCSDNPNATCYNVPNSSGGTSSYEVTWETFDVCTAFNKWGNDYCSSPNGHPAFHMIQSIVLPDKTSYTFKYDSGTTPGNYGELTDVTLPTGATVHYSYGTFADVATGSSDFSPNRWVTGYSTGEGSWTLQPQVVGANTAGCPCNQVTITKPSNDQEVYTFWGGAPTNPTDYLYNGTWNTKVQYFNGAATGNPIMTTETDYTHPGDDPFPASTTVSVVRPGGTLYKKTTYTWKQNGSGVMNAPKTINEYGYGLLQPGSLLRTTKFTYRDEVNSAYANANITNKPVSKAVYDGAGNKIAETTYEYDNYTESLSGSGDVQHDPNFGTGYTLRGNVTAVQVWRNTDGAYITTTRNQYNDAGEITKTTDANGNATRYDYLDAWNDATCKPAFEPGIGGNAGVFATTTTDALGHVFKATYNSCSGTLASSTDPNNQTTTYSYEPLFDRLQRIFLPATLLNGALTQGGTWMDYTSATQSAPEQSDFYTALTQSPASGCLGCSHKQVVLDNLGRESLSKIMNDPDGQVSVRKQYDSSGRVQRVSNPYRGSDNGGEIYSYDGLDRKLAITYTDGSIEHVYYGPDIVNVSGAVGGQYSSTDLAYPTLFVDQAGKQRETWTDAFGRLVEIDEPGASSSGSASFGSLTVNGAVHATTVQTQPATQSTATVFVSGSEAMTHPCDQWDDGDPPACTDYSSSWVWDSGNAYLGLIFQGSQYGLGAGYGNGSTVASVASNAVSNINASSPNHSLTASWNGSYITLHSTAYGSSTNYALTYDGSTTDDPTDFSGPSFYLYGDDQMTGGHDAVYTTATDSGTVTISLPTFSASACYGPHGSCTIPAECPTGDSTATQVACALVSSNNPNSLNRPSSPVNATYTGATITFRWKTSTSAGNGSMTVTSNSNQPQAFPNGSFSGNSTLAGGTDPYPAGLQHPYVTLYTYDTLGNLLCVEQHGSTTSGTGCSSYPNPATNDPWRTRMFNYNSLSELLTAENPESGTIGYGYDGNGNMTSKTAPAPNQTGTATVTTTYTYDALNRVTARSYSDNTTPTANFAYDIAVGGSNPLLAQTNIIGRLSGAWTATAGSAFSYDAVGQVVMNSQATPLIWGSTVWPINYNYDLDGNIASYTSGTGVTFTQTLDVLGRVTQIASSLADGQHPAILATVDSHTGYSPVGDILKLSLGNGLTETAAYNSRLQPCRMNVNSSGTTLSQCGDAPPAGNLQDFSYNFGTANAADNGNLVSISAAGARNFNRNYNYDVLNRLQSMSAPGDPCDGISWIYDAWGNRTDQNGPCFTSHITVNSQNRLNAPYQYDSVGNLTFDGVNKYFYDAENRVVQVNGTLGNCSTATACYSYDALGRRVEKMIGSAKTDYIYDLFKHVVTEESNACAPLCASASYVYLNDKLVAEYKDSTTYFIHKDELGSTRLVTKVDASIMDSPDYLPFGEQMSGTTTTTHKFTGKERDGETGNDYFGARYYASALGRFTIPDWSRDPVPVPFAELSNPQSLNLYAYVKNNPTSGVDADGHDAPVQEGSYSTGVDCGGARTCIINPENPRNGPPKAPTPPPDPIYTIKRTVYDKSPNWVLIRAGVPPAIPVPGPTPCVGPSCTPQPPPVPPRTLEEFCKAHPDICNPSMPPTKPLPHSWRRNRTWWETFRCALSCGQRDDVLFPWEGGNDSWDSCESAGKCSDSNPNPHAERPEEPNGKENFQRSTHPADNLP